MAFVRIRSEMMALFVAAGCSSRLKRLARLSLEKLLAKVGIRCRSRGTYLNRA